MAGRWTVQPVQSTLFGVTLVLEGFLQAGSQGFDSLEGSQRDLLRDLMEEVESLEPKDERRTKVRGLLYERWVQLQDVPTALEGDALGKWKRRRGYALERILFILFALEGLKPSSSFKNKGEQIDGMFDLGGRYFLVETKWEDHETPASAIFAFRGKVEGKLSGTLGLFVSVGKGFSEDAEAALRWGKDLNILLADGGDIDHALREEHGFRKVMGVKLRRAAQYGAVYYSYTHHVDDQAARAAGKERGS